NDTTMIPPAMASRNFSCQNDRHRRVWSAKYNHQDGMIAVNSRVMNATISEATAALVHVHSHSLSLGSTRSRTRLGTGGFMVSGILSTRAPTRRKIGCSLHWPPMLADLVQHGLSSWW